MLTIKKKIIDLKKQYNNLQADTTKHVETYFQNYTFDARVNEETKLRAPIRIDTRNQLNSVRNEIPKERERIYNKIEAIKNPYSSSEDINKKILGESFKQTTLIFLNSPRSTQEIVNEFKNCLKSGKYEAAFLLYDNTIGKLPTNGILTKAQKQLSELMNEAYSAFPHKDEIDSLNNELNQVSEAEEMIQYFENQLSRNNNQIALVHSEMTSEEQAETQSFVYNSNSLTQVEKISMQNRLFEFSKVS